MNLYNDMTEQELKHLLDNKMGKLLGEGNHGKVFELGDDYVIKYFIGCSYTEDYVALEALQESKFTPRLYAHVHDTYVVMEKVRGITLSDYLTINKTLPEGIETQVEELIREYAELGWQLPDLKEREHILWIEEDRAIKYIDFGVMDNFITVKERHPEFYKKTIDNQVKDSISVITKAKEFGIFV
ncbi:hypothetical protein ACEU2D_18065 [Brevibacillus laterosporus]|uniref:hypothetical protein n=1 Tax=Brevibacillus laterosporus TaxID=1465 RepID=UPI0035A59812